MSLERGADSNIACDTAHSSALTAACNIDDADAVALLLQHGACPDGLQQGAAPDFFAFPLGSARSAEVVDLLVAAGADVNARQCSGNTALHDLAQTTLTGWSREACQRLAAAIETLIRHGADPQALDAHGRPPAMLASSVQVSRALAGGPSLKPADLGRLLLEATEEISTQGQVDLVLDLLEHADIDDVNWTQEFQSAGDTILMHVVKAMGDSYREPPLAEYVTIAQRLLELGAAVDAVETLFGESVLHKLCRVPPDGMSAADIIMIESVAQLLIAAHVPLNLENDEGSRALDLVRSVGLFEILRRHGATLGRTHVALFAAMEELARNPITFDEVDALLAAGIPLEARSPLGDTPFLLGARLDSPPLLDHLARQGADVRARGADDATALHIACSVNAADAAQWLIANGASCDAQDAQGRTPFELTPTKALRLKLARVAKAAVIRQHTPIPPMAKTRQRRE